MAVLDIGPDEYAASAGDETARLLYASRALYAARSYAAPILLAALFVTLSCTSSAFLRPQNLLNIVEQQAPLGIIAVAVTIVIISGNFDLSTGSIVAVTNVISAEIAVHAGSAGLSIAAAVALGLVLGIANGLVVTLLNVHSFLATLASSLVFSGIALLITNGALIPVPSASFAILGQNSVGLIGIAAIVFVAFTVISVLVLNTTVFGRHVFAVGGNSEAALLSGVRVNLTRVAAFAASGLASGIAGAILASRVSSGQPTQGADLTTSAIAAVILGGTSIFGGSGAIWRSIVGVFLLALINNGFNLLNANQFYENLATGVVIIAAVALAAIGRRR